MAGITVIAFLIFTTDRAFAAVSEHRKIAAAVLKTAKKININKVCVFINYLNIFDFDRF